MRYETDARLENDRPCLRIHDADSHTLRLVWQYPRPDSAASTAELAEQRSVRDLFRELFLLSLVRHEEGGVKLRLTGVSDDRPADRCNR